MLKSFWLKWKQFGKRMGDVVARVFLTVFYFTIALPFALLVRLTQDPMDVRSNSGAGWVSRTAGKASLDEAGRSF